MKTIRSRVYRLSWALGFLAATSMPVLASGSSYSRFGVGDLVRYGGSRIDAMGGAGIALTGEGFLNLLNPAGLSRIRFTRFNGAFEYSRFSSTDALGDSQYGNGGFKSASFGIPISVDDGITLLLEASPYSSVGYAIRVGDDLLQQDFYGTGGLSLLAIGTSYRPMNNVSFGARANYLYGRIRQLGSFTFLDPSFTNSEIERSDYYSAFNVTLGGILDSVGTLIGSTPLTPLSVGFVLSTPETFSVRRNSVLTATQMSDTTLIASGSADLPFGFGLGLSYIFSSRYQLTADIYSQQWSGAKLYGATMPDIRNSVRYAFGFESLPQRDTETYWRRVAYRLGIAYHQTSYVFNGTAVNELSVSGGLSLPIGPDARMEVGLQIGTRGTASANLQKDTIIRLSLSLNASEVWFMNIEDE